MPAYRKVTTFSDVRKLWCNLPKVQEKRPNLRVFHHKDANEIANSEDPDQTAPLTYLSKNFGSLWYFVTNLNVTNLKNFNYLGLSKGLLMSTNSLCFMEN